MKKIRNNVFETNSSSCHSLTVAETPNFNWTIVPDEKGIITIRGDGFGQGSGEKYYDSITKSDYLATSVVVGNGWYDDDENEDEVVPALPEDPHDCELFLIERSVYPEDAKRLVNIIKEHTKAKFVHLVPHRSMCYIDHQSQGLGKEFFDNNDDAGIKNFLFNGESYSESDYG